MSNATPIQGHYDTSSVFVAVIGRPNVGKSSLTNLLVGEKVAIVTSKPQTTRTRITGVITRGPLQYVLLDTPGVHKARNKLGKRMDKTASDSIADVDVSMMLFEPYGALNESEMVLVDMLRSSGGLLGIQLFLPGRVQSCRVAGGAVQQHRAILDVQNGHAVHVQCAGIHAVQGHLLCRGRRLEGIKFRLLHGHIPHAVGGVKAKNKCSIVAGSRTVIGRTGNSDRLSQRLRRCLRIGYRLAGTAVHRRKGRRAAQQAQAQGQCRCKNPELFFHRTHPPLFAGHPAILRFDRTSCFSVQQFPECVVFRHIPTHSGSKISSHHVLYHFMFIYEPYYGIHFKQNSPHNSIGVIIMDELRIKKLSEPVTFTIRVDKSIVDFYDDLAGKTNRSRNELIGLALDYAKDKIIVEE